MSAAVLILIANAELILPDTQHFAQDLGTLKGGSGSALFDLAALTTGLLVAAYFSSSASLRREDILASAQPIIHNTVIKTFMLTYRWNTGISLELHNIGKN